MNKTIFVLGGTGFIGHEVVVQARQAEWQVKALVRSEEGANTLRQVGGHSVMGDVYRPGPWVVEARGSTALIDLTQPRLPKRLSRSAMLSLSAERQAMTRAVLGALLSLPADERPIFFSVSGADDLEPDAQGTISDRSLPRSHPRGFAYIGIPVRRLVEASGNRGYVCLLRQSRLRTRQSVRRPVRQRAQKWVGSHPGEGNEPPAAHPRDRCGSRAGPPRWTPTHTTGRPHLRRHGRRRHDSA